MIRRCQLPVPPREGLLRCIRRQSSFASSSRCLDEDQGAEQRHITAYPAPDTLTRIQPRQSTKWGTSGHAKQLASGYTAYAVGRSALLPDPYGLSSLNSSHLRAFCTASSSSSSLFCAALRAASRCSPACWRAWFSIICCRSIMPCCSTVSVGRMWDGRNTCACGRGVHNQSQPRAQRSQKGPWCGECMMFAVACGRLLLVGRWCAHHLPPLYHAVLLHGQCG